MVGPAQSEIQFLSNIPEDYNVTERTMDNAIDDAEGVVDKVEKYCREQDDVDFNTCTMIAGDVLMKGSKADTISKPIKIRLDIAGQIINQIKD